MVSIPTGFGHWEYGRLATLKLKDKPAEYGGQDDPDLNNVWWDDKGVHPNTIIPVVADPIGGSQGWFDTVVKVTKAGPNDKYGDVAGRLGEARGGLQGDPALRLHRRPAPQDAPGDGGLGRAGKRQGQRARRQPLKQAAEPMPPITSW